MEMPAGNQQGRGQSVLSLGLSVWRDQLNHVVALVGTINGFVGFESFQTNLDKQSLLGRKKRSFRRISWSSSMCGRTNNHLVDTNYQILQITVWLGSKEEILSCHHSYHARHFTKQCLDETGHMNLWSGFLSAHVIDRALNIRYGLCSINTVRTLFVCLFVCFFVCVFVCLVVTLSCVDCWKEMPRRCFRIL